MSIFGYVGAVCKACRGHFFDASVWRERRSRVNGTLSLTSLSRLLLLGSSSERLLLLLCSSWESRTVKVRTAGLGTESSNGHTRLLCISMPTLPALRHFLQVFRASVTACLVRFSADVNVRVWVRPLEGAWLGCSCFCFLFRLLFPCVSVTRRGGGKHSILSAGGA